jgi:hypothetical protein
MKSLKCFSRMICQCLFYNNQFQCLIKKYIFIVLTRRNISLKKKRCKKGKCIQNERKSALERMLKFSVNLKLI